VSRVVEYARLFLETRVVPLIAAGMTAVVLIGVTVWSLRSGNGGRRWVGLLGALVLFGTPLHLAAHLYVLDRHGGAPAYPVLDARYFVSSHGQLTEVPEEVWLNLQTYQTITWLFTPVGILVGLGLLGGYLHAGQDREMEERLRGRRP
jgi:hypothetical protein